MVRAGSFVPAVLREEPPFRLLFAGQFLSVIGDRMSMLVLPFAVRMFLRGEIAEDPSRKRQR